MKKTMTKLVNYHFTLLNYRFKICYLQIPDVGGIFAARKCQKRIEEYEKSNPYKPVIEEPGHFTANITEEMWNQIYDPTMKQRKKLRKNWIDVRKCKTVVKFLYCFNFSLQVIRSIIENDLRNCYLVDNNGNSRYRKLKNDVSLNLKCSIDANCPVKWTGTCTRKLLELKRSGIPMHRRDTNKCIRLKPFQTGQSKYIY